jgi:hypothetical protein
MRKVKIQAMKPVPWCLNGKTSETSITLRIQNSEFEVHPGFHQFSTAKSGQNSKHTIIGECGAVNFSKKKSDAQVGRVNTFHILQPIRKDPSNFV